MLKSFKKQLKELGKRVCHACSGWGHVAYPPAKNLVCPVTLLVDYCYYNSDSKEEFNKALGKPAKIIVRKPTVDEKTWVSTFFPIPGDAAHVHEGTTSYFIDWESVYNK